MRLLVRQKKREEATREAMNEEDMKHKKLSADQISLYHMVQRQVKRELRKVKKEFHTSAACQDIMQLSEISLQAMKQELISFMAEHPPGEMKVPNPKNARIRAMIETYEQRLKSLQDEKKQWIELRATFEPDINIPGENKIHTDSDIHEEKYRHAKRRKPPALGTATTGNGDRTVIASRRISAEPKSVNSEGGDEKGRAFYRLPLQRLQKLWQSESTIEKPSRVARRYTRTERRALTIIVLCKANILWKFLTPLTKLVMPLTVEPV
ncbi:hypothetical protein PsorP6_012393 [Peronosclerospora sorghi]|uniref:Uncharacterized protein n=1 Tax=Peronosclerospora sorghi TaxID=230839 RepID=A0ACC0WI12_9STRA|nr:hypothetical protein PsorP6_012393 [Peronosclerospora sorghi]